MTGQGCSTPPTAPHYFGRTSRADPGVGVRLPGGCQCRPKLLLLPRGQLSIHRLELEGQRGLDV